MISEGAVVASSRPKDSGYWLSIDACDEIETDGGQQGELEIEGRELLL